MSGAAGIALRPMTERDLEAVLAIERALFPEDAWSEGMFRDELAHRATRHYLVAEDAGEIVGYAGMFAQGGEADVQTIAVRSDQWGRGIGRTLLATLLDEAVRRGCGEVYLEVRADNDRAQRLYRWFGFEQVGIRPGYYQEAGADAVVMRLVCPPDRERRTRAIASSSRDEDPASGRRSERKETVTGTPRSRRTPGTDGSTARE